MTKDTEMNYKRYASKSMSLGGSLDNGGIRLETPQLGVNVHYICDVEAAGRADLPRHYLGPCNFTTFSYKRSPLSTWPAPCHSTRVTVEAIRECSSKPCSMGTLGPTFCRPAAIEFITQYGLRYLHRCMHAFYEPMEGRQKE